MQITSKTKFRWVNGIIALSMLYPMQFFAYIGDEFTCSYSLFGKIMLGLILSTEILTLYQIIKGDEKQLKINLLIVASMFVIVLFFNSTREWTSQYFYITSDYC